jgi:hypothetical protein
VVAGPLNRTSLRAHWSSCAPQGLLARIRHVQTAAKGVLRHEGAQLRQSCIYMPCDSAVCKTCDAQEQSQSLLLLLTSTACGSRCWLQQAPRVDCCARQWVAKGFTALPRRFSSWMESTSPYTARKTPPTASMKSIAAGAENTPPGHDMARGLSEKGVCADKLPSPSLGCCSHSTS